MPPAQAITAAARANVRPGPVTPVIQNPEAPASSVIRILIVVRADTALPVPTVIQLRPQELVLAAKHREIAISVLTITPWMELSQIVPENTAPLRANVLLLSQATHHLAVQ